MNKPIKAIIQTKNGLRTILTGYHIKNNPNCLAMYSTSTGKLVIVSSQIQAPMGLEL
jgi:hypothetical protein